MRFWEIDLLRGVAVVMMVFYHLLFDLHYYSRSSSTPGPWMGYGAVIASIFLLLVGISLTLSRSKGKTHFSHYLKRGLKIFSLGLVITGATWVYPREGFVIFGVLHLIGASILLVYPFLAYRFVNLFLGLVLIVLGLYLQSLTFDFPWVLWLGFVPRGFYALDYFPLLPWFGVVLLGIFVGNSIYKSGIRSYPLTDLSGLWPVEAIAFLGRNSLVIYLIHQPALILLLGLAGVTNLWLA
jgi:uncharacterized membrane protein